MNSRLRSYAVLAVMPLFFVSNLIIGRPAVETVPPWTLATLRWGLACLILAPFALPPARAHARALIAARGRILLLGFLGMWICGGIVYLALLYTTATHGTLIYTASPAIVVLIQALIARRPLPLAQTIGVLFAIGGVFVIVLEGNPIAIFSHQFNIGDLMFVFAAIAWAFYSLLLKDTTLQTIPTLTLFFMIALAGTLMLLPCMLIELAPGDGFPVTLRAWASIAGIVIFASVLSFSAYQHGIKTVGPAITSIFLYLLPCYGIVLAALFLGERIFAYHGVGLLLVLVGIALATGISNPWKAARKG